MIKSLGSLAGLLMVSVLMTSAGMTASASEDQMSTPSFLYVMVAKTGRIAKGDDNDYVILVNKRDMQHVLETSKHPFLLADYTSSDEIVKTWKENAGNFGKGVTMEGTIFGADKALPSVRIKAINKTADDIRYVFYQRDNAPVDLETFGTLQSVTVVNYCCHLHGEGGEWLWSGK